MKNIALVVLAGGLIFGAWLFWSSSNDQRAAERAYEAAGGTVAAAAGITIPTLSAEAAKGRALFNGRCASCHGVDASGGPSGPTLIHKVYEPSHHSDAAFHLAVQNGVTAHHWPFGNMPAQTGVTRAMTDTIIAFVREVQRANGIE